MAASPNGTPSVSQRRNRANQFVVLASGLDESEALTIRADARVSGATLFAGARLDYELGSMPYAYLAPARGVIAVNGIRLEVGDGIAMRNETRLMIAAEQDSEVIVVETA